MLRERLLVVPIVVIVHFIAQRTIGTVDSHLFVALIDRRTMWTSAEFIFVHDLTPSGSCQFERSENLTPSCPSMREQQNNREQAFSLRRMKNRVLLYSEVNSL